MRLWLRNLPRLAVALVLLLLIRSTHDQSHLVDTPLADPTTPRDALIYLYAEADAVGWTAATRQTYAALRQRMGEITPLAILNPNDSGLVRQQVAAAIHRQDWQTARSALQTLVELDPTDSQANYQLGLVLAIETPASADPYLNVALRDAQVAPTVRAIQPLLTVADTESRCRQVGFSLLSAEEWAFAEYAYSQVIELNPQDWLALTYRGYIRDQRGANGLSDLETAIGLNPTGALPFYFLGLHWRLADDLPAAGDAFMSAHFLDSENPAITAEIAATFRQMGNNDQTAEWLNITVGLDAENIGWQRLRAAFYADTGYLLEEEGMAYIEEAYDHFPDDPSIAASLGYAHHRLDNSRTALAYLEFARDADPTDARSHYYYGLVMLKLGNTAAAQSAFYAAIDAEGSLSGFGFLADRALSTLS